MLCETVKVKNPKDPAGGYLVINLADFDPERHKRWTPEPEPVPKAVAAKGKK